MKYHSEHLKNNRADPIDIEILSANLTTLPTSGSIITSYTYHLEMIVVCMSVHLKYNYIVEFLYESSVESTPHVTGIRPAWGVMAHHYHLLKNIKLSNSKYLFLNFSQDDKTVVK